MTLKGSPIKKLSNINIKETAIVYRNCFFFDRFIFSKIEEVYKDKYVSIKHNGRVKK